mmetsp:Transcript_18264/g.33947  ORF Transcript_18264/g.33947 Transcript_18264/m.33947 type:complete len:468 (+) Transcript_18264:129-1532(+)
MLRVIHYISLALFWGLFITGVAGSSDNDGSNLRVNRDNAIVVEDAENQQRALLDASTAMMLPGKRVASLDRKNAICAAAVNMDLSIPLEETVISFYYAIESTVNITTSSVIGRNLVRKLEDKLFYAINPSILWCYYDEGTNIGKRNLLESSSLDSSAHRRMTMDEARRLSIVTFSTSPEDEEAGVPCNFPTIAPNCIVMHGMMTVIHHVTSDISLAIASIYDSSEMAMNNSGTILLDGSEEFEGVTNVEWLGETLDDATAGGPNGIGGGAAAADRGNTVPIAYAVSIPLLILLALALFVARNKARRQALTPSQLMALENGNPDVLVGTGDPPRSFHEGMYHYTRHGARYLSTNCPDCIETKRNGFFTETDLETIHEGRYESFEEISLVATNTSASTTTKDSKASSDHRKRRLVEASDTALGVKHSSIDVHQCTSTTCPICVYKPADVSFVGNVDQKGASGMFGSSDV